MTAHAGTAFVDVRPDFSNFNRDVDRNVKGTRSKFAAVGKGAALGFAAGIGGAAIAVKGFVNAAIESEKSQARMQTQLKASGISYKAHAKEIDAVIQKVSKLSGLDDEDLQDSFTNIVRVTGDVNESLKLTGLAADFARAKHMDVAKAGELVAKVAGGNTGILKRYGVQVDKNATSQEALAALQKKFAGQAEAYGKTTAGAQDRFNVAIENLQETLGQKLLPVLAAVANAAANFVNGLQTGEGVGERFGLIIDKVKEAVNGLAPVFQGMVDTATVLWGAFGSTITDSVKDTVEFVGRYVTALMEIFRGLSDFISGVFSGDWGRAWSGIKQIFSGAWDAMKAIVGLAWERIKTVVDLGIKALVAVIKAAAGLLVDAGKWIVNRIADGITTVTDALASVGGWIKNRVVEFVKASADALVGAGSWIVNRIVDGVKTVTDALAGVGGWIKNRIVEFIQLEADGMKTVGSWIVNRVVDGFRTVTDALSGVGSWLKNRVSDAVDGAKDGFMSIGKSAVGWIVDGLKGGANLLIGFVNKIIDVINKVPGVDIGHVAGFRDGGVVDDTTVPGFARGGVVHHDQFATGGEITRPMVVVGEEAPSHPEFVIPTNPAYRGRAVGLFGQLGKQLGIPGFALGGILGDLPGTGGLGWLKGTGEFLIKKASSYVTDKIGDALGGILGDSAPPALDKVIRLGEMVKAMNDINAKHWPYVYGGGHGSFAGPYDCSGLVSAILHAGNFLGSPQSTDGLKVFGEGGDGEFITIGVRGSTGRNAHTMMKLGNRYLESGSGHGAQWVNGWSGNFPIHRHPAGFATGGILDEEFLKGLVGNGGLGWGLRKGGVLGGPFVGSYKLGGVVPRDGMAQVHQGEAILPNGFDPQIHVYIGNEPVDARVEVVMTERDRRSRQVYRAGSLR